MKIHEVQQGTDEWRELRASYFTASEAPAMLGLSKYMSRGELLRQKSTGIVKDVDDATLRRFDAGHEAEAKTRAWAEAFIGEELYPTTGTLEVEGLPLLTSFDGVTMDESTCWENKLWNEVFANQVRDGIVPDTHWPQLEQQMLVSGASRVLFTVSDGEENTVSLWYESNPKRRVQLIAGWKQFAIDLANYQHVEIAERPKADVVVDLPSLFVHAKGEITTHNMDEFGAALMARLAETRATVLVTDQDFSNAKEAAKKFRETAKAIALSKEQMLAQTQTIGEAARKMDAWAKDLNATALQLEKDVERVGNSKKEAMVLSGKTAYAEHVAALEAEIAPIRMNLTAPNFADAIKGKSKYASMQDAVDTMLAGAKMTADAVAKDVRIKIAWCKENAAGHSALFPDLQQIIVKPMEDFALTITSRIDKAKADEAVRLESERAKIRAEEQAKLNAQASAALESSPVHAAIFPPTPLPESGAPVAAIQPSPVADDGARIKICDINASLYPLSMTADTLKALGFEPVGNQGAAKLYKAGDFLAICESIVRHVQTAATNNQKMRKAA